MIGLAASFALGTLTAALAAIMLRRALVPSRMRRLFSELPKTMRFDLATPHSMRNMVVLAEPGLEPWFAERDAANMLHILREQLPERPPALPPAWRRDGHSAAHSVRYHPACAPPGATLPAEYDPLDAVVLAWPWHYPSRWAHHAAFAKVIVEAGARALILSDERQDRGLLANWLGEHIGRTDKIDILDLPVDDVWVRDYGPAFVRLGDGGGALVANAYVPLEHPYRKGDNAVSFAIGAALDLPVYRLPLTVEGGNLVGDGHGLMVSTTATLDRNPELDRDDVSAVMARFFGCDRTIFIEALPGEVTGHADMILRFIDAATAVVASAPPSHRWAAAFDRIASQIETLPSRSGAPFRVLRLPLATSRHASAFWSYVNCTQVNGTTIVPQFGVAGDADALDFYRTATGGTVVGIDYSDFLVGSVHCQSKEVPRGLLRRASAAT